MDKRAKKILLSAFWGPSGWNSDSARDQQIRDIEYLKSKGVLFEPVCLDHDETVSRAIEVCGRLDPVSVANAFVASLETRELDFRSALGSYAVLRHMPSHQRSGAGVVCSVCGEYSTDKEKKRDLNVLNFERLKWGGVRHLYPYYALFDLEQFLQEPVQSPSGEAVAILRSLLESLGGADSRVSAAKLHTLFPKSLKSNKSEREVIIAILGFCGVLGTNEHRGFLESFVAASEREIPSRRFVDMPYPACWWTGEDGIYQAAVEKWFGHLL